MLGARAASLLLIGPIIPHPPHLSIRLRFCPVCHAITSVCEGAVCVPIHTPPPSTQVFNLLPLDWSVLGISHKMTSVHISFVSGQEVESVEIMLL